MLIRLFLVVCVVLVALTGCGGGDKNKTEMKEKTIARVNGKAITDKEFNAFLKFKRIPENNDQAKKRALEQYLERETLATAIEEQKLLDTQLLEAELREFKKEMLIGRYFEKFLEDKVSQEAVRNYYNTKASEYEQRKAKVAHILIRTNKKMSEPERQAKLTAIKEVYSKIMAGADFGKMAKEYSEDKISAKKDGSLGWIKEGTIDKRFSKTAFGLTVGSVSEPFETPFGFHVVKLLEAPQIVKKPLKAVAGSIRYQLRNQAKKAEMERLKGQVKVDKK